ncbi:MAG: tyrosine-type recombinase/integrase [Weeksellaceae bacterium]|mgnify:CR=1 FL=1|jgi:integrase/recombinase XerC|nr:tyrosine-type recombinase/integrase [Weeksellaceae bacterium]
MSIQKFVDYLRLEKNYSEKTIESYQNDLNGFVVFYLREHSTHEIACADKTDIRNFLMHLSRSGLSGRSINRKISSLKTYYKYLIKVGEIEKSPAAMVSSLKHNNKVRIPFSEDEILNLFKLPGIFSDDFEGNRNQMILELLYQTGIRRAELIGLRLSDVDLVEKRLKVIGKRNKERLIPINDELNEHLNSYIEERNTLFGNELDNLFLTKRGKALYDKFVYNLVNNYLSIVSTKTNKSPHIMRHSFATHLLNRGANLNAIKELLGHSSLAATQVYTHSGIEQLKEVFNKAHPRSDKN